MGRWASEAGLGGPRPGLWGPEGGLWGPKRAACGPEAGLWGVRVGVGQPAAALRRAPLGGRRQKAGPGLGVWGSHRRFPTVTRSALEPLRSPAPLATPAGAEDEGRTRASGTGAQAGGGSCPEWLSCTGCALWG